MFLASNVGERPRWPIQSPNKGRKKKVSGQNVVLYMTLKADFIIFLAGQPQQHLLLINGGRIKFQNSDDFGWIERMEVMFRLFTKADVLMEV